MYQNPRGRPPPRPIRTDAPLEGRRLWEIGSWGNASDQIGQQWELLGGEALARRLAADRQLWARRQPSRLVALAGHDETQSQLQGIGLTNPDALLLDPLAAPPAGAPTDPAAEPAALSLRPVDYKWSLETASYRQISGQALAELLAHPSSPLRDVIQAAGLSVPPSLTTQDGFFYAPEHRANRQFLESPANRRQEFPLEPRDVVFEPVDGPAFFGALPWWPQALRLAELDRATRSLATLESAERYYRLGAGLGGAIQKLQTPIFAAEPPPLDVAGLAEELILKQRCRGSLEVIEYLRRLMDARGERVRRLRELSRCPYSFRELAGDLARRGITLPEAAEDEASRAERERWGRLHRAVAEAHRAAVSAAGLELLAQGQSESAALAALERRRPELEARARAHAHRLLRQELGG